MPLIHSTHTQKVLPMYQIQDSVLGMCWQIRKTWWLFP